MSRQLAAGGKDLFEVAINPGQLFRVSIQKGDLALGLAVFDPAGQKSLDYVSSVYEEIDLLFPSRAGGIYRFEITSLERVASRSYKLTAQAAPPGGHEHERFAAQQAMSEAGSFRSEWRETSLRRAVEIYQKAARMFVAAQDGRQAAIALMRAGEIFFVLSEYRDALHRYEQAISIAKGANANLEAAEALSEISRLYSYLGDNAQADRGIKTAVETLAQMSSGGDVVARQLYARALSNWGEIDYSKGNFFSSVEDFKSSLERFREVGDRRGQARVYLFQGYIQGTSGARDKALTQINAAWSLYQETADKPGEGLCLTALGLSHSLKHEPEQAIQLLRRAGEIFRTIGDRYSEATTINAEGQTYEHLTKYPMALEKYQEALRLFQDDGALDAAAVTIFKAAQMYRLTGDKNQALLNYNESLRLSRAAGKHRLQASILSDVALIYASQGSRTKTVRQYQKNLKFCEVIGDRRQQAITLNSFGDYLLGVGDKPEALKVYEQALNVIEQVHDETIRISSLYKVARALRELNKPAEALPYIKQSIEVIEELRNNVESPDYRASYFSGVHRHFELLVDILMQLDRQYPGQGYAAKALLANEEGRARSLIDLIIQSGADIRRDADPSLLEDERELQGLIRSQAQYEMQLSMKGVGAAESSEVARQKNELLSRYQLVEARLREHNPRLGALSESGPGTISEIQSQLLDNDSILLEYALGDDRSYLWVITRDSFSSYELPPRKTVEDLAVNVYKLLTARQNKAGDQRSDYATTVETADRLYPEQALQLSKMLLGPVAGQLGAKRIIAVTEGVLQLIPMDALPAPEINVTNASAVSSNAQLQPALVTVHEVVSLPSLATLAAIRHEKPKSHQNDKVVAVLADPVFSESDDRVQIGKSQVGTIPAEFDDRGVRPELRDLEASRNRGGLMRLTHAGEEADAILAAARSGGMAAKGFDASRETATGSIVSQYRIIHFATHGFLNNENPEWSGLVLTLVNRDGTSTDGFMPLRDIYNLDLSADLVVLSACDTALGKDLRGEGLVGLTRGFMASGSKSVVASLWKVDDRSTAVLMAHFYRSMLRDGLTPAAALKSAKEAVRREPAWHSPYFWAGFVLQGEYQNRIVATQSSGVRTPAGIVLTLICLTLGVIVLHRVRGRRKQGPY